jgi:shikimate kinase
MRATEGPCADAILGSRHDAAAEGLDSRAWADTGETRRGGSRETSEDGYVVHEGCDHIFFVGFLGAGKSTLARNLGHMFNRRYVDTDRLVERACHRSVTQIFRSSGEDAFRDYETHELSRLSSRRSLLVSCGGGIVERPDNERIMHEMGVIVYLEGSLEDSLRQIRHPEKRPDLGDREHAAALFAHRRPLYEGFCDYRVSIAGKTFDEVLASAGELLWEKGLL